MKFKKDQHILISILALSVALFIIFFTIYVLYDDYYKRKLSALDGFGFAFIFISIAIFILIKFVFADSNTKNAKENISNKKSKDVYIQLFHSVMSADDVGLSFKDIYVRLEQKYTIASPFKGEKMYIFFDKGKAYKAALNDINKKSFVSDKTLQNYLAKAKKSFKSKLD